MVQKVLFHIVFTEKNDCYNSYFKLSFFFFQPFLGGGEFTNAISGKIKLVKEVLVTLDGHWDDTVMMKDKKTGVSFLLLFL